MKKLGCIALAIAAVCALTVYFFCDLDISSRTERMSWDEFSANPVAVAHFRDRAALNDPLAPLNDQETKRAYEHYAFVSSQHSGGSSLANTRGGDQLEEFRIFWRRLYHLWAKIPTDSLRILRKGSNPWPIETRERLGILATLLALGIIAAGLSLAIRYADEKARV